ncbi:hypothetical protein Plhal703r1_c14g0070171 [Plasmopara halstedii]
MSEDDVVMNSALIQSAPKRVARAIPKLGACARTCTYLGKRSHPDERQFDVTDVTGIRAA